MPVDPVCEWHFEVSKERAVCAGEGDFRRDLRPFRYGLQRYFFSKVHRVPTGKRLVLNNVRTGGVFVPLQSGVNDIAPNNLIDKNCSGHPVRRIKGSGVKTIPLHCINHKLVVAYIGLKTIPPRAAASSTLFLSASRNGLTAYSGIPPAHSRQRTA